MPLYKEMTRGGKWETLAENFEKEAFALFGLPLASIAEQTLQTGISVLKTPFCEEKHKDGLIFDGDRDVNME